MATVVKYEKVDVDQDGVMTEAHYEQVKTKKTDVSEEFIMVSKYIHTIFGYLEIPMKLVGITILLGEMMAYRDNTITLSKPKKEIMAAKLGISYQATCNMIQECKKYNIIAPLYPNTRCSEYMVSPYVVYACSRNDRQELKAFFDFKSNNLAIVDKYTINDTVIKRAITHDKKGIKGQLSLFQSEEFIEDNEGLINAEESTD